jgi:hypothetical protein
MLNLMSSLLGLDSFEEENCHHSSQKKETVSLQFVVDLQALCILETLSLQMFLAAL